MSGEAEREAQSKSDIGTDLQRELLKQQLQESLSPPAESTASVQGPEADDLLAPAGRSPLSEVDPNSINDLIKNRISAIFNMDPLKMTTDGPDSDLAVAVRFYREQRQKFAEEAKGAKLVTAGTGTGSAATKKKVPKTIKAALDLSLLDKIQ